MKTTLCLTVFLFYISIAQSQISNNYTPTADNTIYSENINHSNGAGEFLVVGKSGANTRRALLKFDISNIPSFATVTGVEIKLAGGSGSGTVNIHRIDEDWGEGTSDAPGNEYAGTTATANDATWEYCKYMTCSWTDDGGDFTATASASGSISSGNETIISSPQLITDVQDMINNGKNYGWMLRGNETINNSAFSIKSRQSLIGVPALKVTFTIPARRIIINEVNISVQWIELFNPGPDAKEVKDWYLCNNGTCDQISSGAVTVLDGMTNIPGGEFLRIMWTGVTPGTGEVALMKWDDLNFFQAIEDYVQYGAGNQQRAPIGVVANVWDDATKFVGSPAVGQSIGIKTVRNLSGEDTSSPDWEEQNPTPAAQNICDPFLEFFMQDIPTGNYQATDILINESTVKSTPIPAIVTMSYENSVVFTINSTIEDGATLTIMNEMCPN